MVLESVASLRRPLRPRMPGTMRRPEEFTSHGVSRHTSPRREKTGVTYPFEIGQAVLEQGTLDECREPLLLVPVPKPIPRDLAQPNYHRVDIRLSCDILQQMFRNPFRLRIAASEWGFRIIQWGFWHWRREFVVCKDLC